MQNNEQLAHHQHQQQQQQHHQHHQQQQQQQQQQQSATTFNNLEHEHTQRQLMNSHHHHLHQNMINMNDPNSYYNSNNSSNVTANANQMIYMPQQQQQQQQSSNMTQHEPHQLLKEKSASLEATNSAVAKHENGYGLQDELNVTDKLDINNNNNNSQYINNHNSDMNTSFKSEHLTEKDKKDELDLVQNACSRNSVHEIVEESHTNENFSSKESVILKIKDENIDSTRYSLTLPNESSDIGAKPSDDSSMDATKTDENAVVITRDDESSTMGNSSKEVHQDNFNLTNTKSPTRATTAEVVSATSDTEAEIAADDATVNSASIDK